MLCLMLRDMATCRSIAPSSSSSNCDCLLPLSVSAAACMLTAVHEAVACSSCALHMVVGCRLANRLIVLHVMLMYHQPGECLCSGLDAPMCLSLRPLYVLCAVLSMRWFPLYTDMSHLYLPRFLFGWAHPAVLGVRVLCPCWWP
jgi:hypothetical protein